MSELEDRVFTAERAAEGFYEDLRDFVREYQPRVRGDERAEALLQVDPYQPYSPEGLTLMLLAVLRSPVREAFLELFPLQRLPAPLVQRVINVWLDGEIFLPKDFYDLVKTLQRYTCRDVAGQITTPTLVMAPELEQFWPGQSQELYGLLTAPKTLARFTVAQGAQFHDEPMAPQHRNAVLFDWMSETLVSR